jgi:hypothetical protein
VLLALRSRRRILPRPVMIDVGQSTGLLKGHLAEKRPEDLPG